ncbi:MAG: AMP-binding protein [Pseudomonadota bacterium]
MIGVQTELDGVVYPPQDVLKGYVEKGYLGNLSLAEALINALPKFGDRIAIGGPEGEVTYAELDDASNRFAASLLELGLKPLDRVLFQVANSKDLIVAIIATYKAGLIPVCTLAAHRMNEISYLATHSGAKAHFIGIESNFDFAAFAEDVRKVVPGLEHTIVIRGEGPSHLPHMTNMILGQDPRVAKIAIDAIERDPYQVTAFQLSGGTTSIPKIIPRFSNEYLYNFTALADTLKYDADDIIFIPLQIMHNAGMIFSMPTFLKGAKLIVSPSLDPMNLFEILKKDRPTIFLMMAAAIDRMKQVNAKALIDFSRTRLVISPNAARQTEEVLGVPGIHLFGMAEGLITFGSPEHPDRARHTTIGRAISPGDEIKILGPGTETELPNGQIGEMVTRGPYTFHGYLDAQERNREAFTSDGFYRSGDLMSVQTIDGVDYYAFEGRLKDVVSRGGEKINCEEVELAARKHPDIADIAIVAMPDPDYEERACAFIIPAGDKAPPTVKELMEFLVADGLAKFKCPERIEAISEFPQTDSGKLSKPKLKVMIVDIQAREKAA